MNRWFVLIPLVALAASQFGCSSTPKTPPDTRAADEKASRASAVQNDVVLIAYTLGEEYGSAVRQCQARLRLYRAVTVKELDMAPFGPQQE